MSAPTDMSPSAGMAAVLNRRSPAKLQAEQPSREAIARLLEAAIRAPNHFRNEPWRFFVLTGEARDRLGEAFAARLAKTLDDPQSPQSRGQLEREKQKTQRAPVLIVVASVRTENAKAMEIEDVEATAAAVENMILAAPSLGLGAFWRTGDPAYDPEIKAYFGLKPADHIVAFLYVGQPEVMGDLTPRTGIDDKTQWLGWN